MDSIIIIYGFSCPYHSQIQLSISFSNSIIQFISMLSQIELNVFSSGNDNFGEYGDDLF